MSDSGVPPVGRNTESCGVTGGEIRRRRGKNVDTNRDSDTMFQSLYCQAIAVYARLFKQAARPRQLCVQGLMDNSKFPFEKEKLDAGTGPAEADAGSVTSMFATPVAPKAQTSTEDLLADLLKPKAVAAQAAPERVVPVVPLAPVAAKPPAVQGKGDVTRLLEELRAAGHAPLRPPVAPAAKVVAAPATDPNPGEFTRIFTQLPTPQPKPPVTPPTAPPLQVQPAPVLPPPAPPVPAVASAQQPGEFTQFLQKMSSAEKLDAGPAAGAAPSGWPAGLPVESSAPLREAPKSSEPGSFTQLFQAVSKGGAAAPPPAPASVEAAAPAAGPGAFTQMFQAISAKPEPLRPTPLQEPPKSAPVSQGGFTQLFDSLASSAPGPQASALSPPIEKPFTLPSAPISQPMPASGGEFTRLMRTLSDPPAATPATAPPMAPAMPLPQSLPQAAPMSQAGPGEFTRIISNSALREAGVGAAFPPLAPSSAPPPGRAAAPAALPQLPHLKPPAMPHAPAPPAGFGLPQAFAPPPAPAPAPAPQSKLQQYLPLIVVLNVAVLLIVVLILIFALRHH
jgi:hypothetical protein